MLVIQVKEGDNIERALKKEPQNPSYLDTYGWILYQKGDYAKAIKYLLDAEQLLNEQNNEMKN